MPVGNPETAIDIGGLYPLSKKYCIEKTSLPAISISLKSTLPEVLGVTDKVNWLLNGLGVAMTQFEAVSGEGVSGILSASAVHSKLAMP